MSASTPPTTHTKQQPEQDLVSRDFLLLFILATFSGCYISIYYCFEQWMERVLVTPGWRGILLGALFGVVMMTRPFATILLLKANKLPPMLLSLFVCSGVLFTYQFLPVDSPFFEWELLAIRVMQGFALAVFSSCTISLLVSCIPPGQSARGYALFSLSFLIPYALIPTIGEFLLPIVGDEPALFAWTASLFIPSVLILYCMRHKLREPEIAANLKEDFAGYRKKLLHNVRHSGLLLAFLAICCFGLCTNTCIYFMKGLCTLTGGDPTQFFFYYTVTMMIVRLRFSKQLDGLPRYKVVPIVAVSMAAGLVIIVAGPLWAYVPGTILYGVSLSLLYPLQASVIYDRSTPETRTVNSNLMTSMFDIAALTSPLLGGAILSTGLSYRAVILMGACTTVLSGILFTIDGIRQRRLAKKAGRQQSTAR